jgi:hypothetical protein
MGGHVTCHHAPGEKMNHGKSLRAIGQSLEAARLANFQIENRGEKYLVLSDSLSLRVRRFTPADIWKLDALGQKQRRSHSSSHTQTSKKLSQLLRSLGNQLDKAGSKGFQITFTSGGVSVDYQKADGQSESRTFTMADLQEVGLHNRIRRDNRTSWITRSIRR